MQDARPQERWHRRAQPMLGTLVEVGVRDDAVVDAAVAIGAAFAAVREAQACLSRFEAGSDLQRFAALRCGEHLVVRPITQQVLYAAAALQSASGGLFDISLGSAPHGWQLAGATLYKCSDAVRLDLGGIGKGHAVDLAVQALRALGCAAGWVNAGGDLRAFGNVDTALHLRDETSGGVRPFAHLRDGAFATSHFGRHGGAQLARDAAAQVHVSVAAPLCLWADALTKVVAGSGNSAHPLLERYAACAWLH